MTIRRRDILIGSAAAGCAAVALGGPRPASATMAPPQDRVLFLHDSGPEVAAYHRLLAQSVSPAIVDAQRIGLLAPGGFAHAAKLIDRAGHARVVALIDTGSAVALEMMFYARRAVLVDRKPAGHGAALLSAVMGERG